jgi:hypothetical protein
MAANKRIGEDIDEESLDLPGVPEDAGIVELPAMKAGDVTASFTALDPHHAASAMLTPCVIGLFIGHL